MSDSDQKQEGKVRRPVPSTKPAPHRPHKATGLTPSKAKKPKSA